MPSTDPPIFFGSGLIKWGSGLVFQPMFVKNFTTASLALLLIGCGKDAEIHRYTEIREFPSAPPSGPQAQLPPSAGPLSVAPVPENRPPDHPTRGEPNIVGLPGIAMQGRESEVPPAPDASDVTWTTPDGWEEQPGSGMRLAAFRPAGAGDRALVTLIPMGPGAGGLDANVTRWRRQVGLPEEHTHEHVQMQGAMPYVLVNLVAESASKNLPSSTMGAIYSIPGRTLFLKFTGDTDLLVESKGGFLALAQSIALKEETTP